MEDGGRQDDEEYKMLCQKIETVEADIQKLLKAREQITTDIENLQERKKNKKESIAAF